MSNAAKPKFSQLLDGNPGNKFDARQVLAKRREARRYLLPWVPIQNFGLQVDETKGGPVSGGEGAAEPTGVGNRNTLT